jgi:predicted enzyme related to lactoylglutathione lyase
MSNKFIDTWHKRRHLVFSMYHKNGYDEARNLAAVAFWIGVQIPTRALISRAGAATTRFMCRGRLAGERPDMDPVTHFEMPADDKKRMAAFYAKVFGWQMQQLGPEMGDYVLAGTTEVDANRMPKTPGSINGGFYQRTDDPVSRHPSVVISVKSVKESMKQVAKAGGKVLGEPQEIPGVGTWVSFLDTEGNRVSMMQPKK